MNDLIEGAHIENATDAMNFMFAGNARLTIVSKRTGERHTFKVVKAKKQRFSHETVYLASQLVGSRNEDDYSYIGLVILTHGSIAKPAASFKFVKQDRVTETRVTRGFKWFVDNLEQASRIRNDQMELWHAGRCGRCARVLTVPSSIANGLGPECATKEGGFFAERVG